MAHFLIVDDEPAVAETFARALRLDGHTASAALTASAGLEAVERATPDAILLDIRLPTVGGLEFLRRIREVPATACIPVGVVTGDYFLKEDVLGELASLGAIVRYKPLWMADVSALARELLRPSA